MEVGEAGAERIEIHPVHMQTPKECGPHALETHTPESKS